MKYRDPITNTFKDLTVKVSDTLPIGTIVGYAGVTAPDGWLICDGSVISRSLYSALFSVIGTTYGAGNGSTTFNIPDYRDRVPVGLDTNDSDFNTLGKTGGEKKHTLTIEEMPSHRHNLQIEFGTTTNLNSDVHGGHYHQTTERTSYPVNDRILDTGGGQSHNILQPYIVENYIIKAYQPIAVPGKIVNNYSTNPDNAYNTTYVNAKYDELYDDIMEGIAQANWYSTTQEIKTLKVSNNLKPIYRRVIENNTINTEVTHNIANIDEIIDLDLMLYQTSGAVSPQEKDTLYFSKTKYTVYLDQSSNISKYKIVVEYTKTIDD